MKKTLIFGGIGIALVAVLIWLGMKNSKSPIQYETETAFKTNIVRKTVATGKVTPLEEIEIKPQISGIIDKIYLIEGAIVKKGDLIAKVRVVPNEQSLSSAKGRVNSAKIQIGNAEVSYNRNKVLFDKGVISKTEFEAIELSYNQAKQDLLNSQNDYEIIRRGSTGSSGSANTNIRAQIAGTILEIPVKEGDQVIESNTFNAGTTIATVADLNKMIFEGKVDEAEVAKLISLNSLANKVRYFFFKGSLADRIRGSIPRELSKMEVAVPGQAAEISSEIIQPSMMPNPFPPYSEGISLWDSPC